MKNQKAQVLGFVSRLAIAALLSGLAFWLLVSPVPPHVLGMRTAVILFRVLDAPVSALNAVLPWRWRSGVATLFTDEARLLFGWPMFRRYMTVGIAAYMILGYGITFAFAGISRARRRHVMAVS